MIKKRDKGFTLVELVMSIIILMIIAGISVYALVELYELWQFTTYGMEMLWSSRTSMEELSKNIRMVRDSKSITVANATRFSFINTDGAARDYQYLGTILYKNGTVYMRRVNSFSFTYYDKNGAVIAVPLVSPKATNIRSVTVNMTLSNGGQAISSKSRVKLRNLLN